MQELKKELRNYYQQRLLESQKMEGKHPLMKLLDTYDQEHPGLNAYQLKSAQYGIISSNFQPSIFKNSPFYYEMGLKPPTCDGYPSAPHPGGWLYRRNAHIFRDINTDEFDMFQEQIKQRIHLSGSYMDTQHYCFPMNNVVKNGLRAIYMQAVDALKQSVSPEETAFIQCAIQGLLAAKKISERFADAADEKLKDDLEPEQRRFLNMIAQSARLVPWQGAEHFYDGLNALWFLREICGSLEGVGNSSLGRPDYLLYPLYLHDLEIGYLTKADTYDLICRFLLTGDCHYDKDDMVVGYGDHELEMGVTLGGCDEDGHEVFNDITLMFLQAHRENKLVYPKIHCRISEKSKTEYLNEINKDYLSGRSVIDLVNDDCLIPALVRDGKSLQDARKYVNIGCWDIDVEGYESAPGGCYFNTIHILELSIYGCDQKLKDSGINCEQLDGCQNFEEVYQRLFRNIIGPLRRRCELIGKNGKVQPQVNPVPFFSACLSDCLEKRKDYSAGGGRYNPHSIAPVGMANVIDALLAIRTLCFQELYCTLSELLTAVRANWEGHERLLHKVMQAPYFGDNTRESATLAKRFHDDLYNNTRDLVNERGGGFALGYYVYREFRLWAKEIRATPDGRHDGEPFAHGIGPSRLRKIDSITAAANSISALDLTKCAANSVVNFVLPIGVVSPIVLEQLERSFAALNLELIQMNCVSKEDLLDARIHPEKHQDLVVRVCGFSAKFTSLSPEWQDEFIRRNMYGAS